MKLERDRFVTRSDPNGRYEAPVVGAEVEIDRGSRLLAARQQLSKVRNWWLQSEA